MLEELKQRVYEANMLLPKYGLVTFTWGNASEIDRETGIFAIKPSGVDYDKLKPEDMVLVDLEGNKVEGKYNPSSDTPTHVELYKAFAQIGGVVHTHSSYAASWAQAGRSIPCYGTTHADYIYGEVPCVRNLTKAEIEEAYEKNTGILIAAEFARLGKAPGGSAGGAVQEPRPLHLGQGRPRGSAQRGGAGRGGQDGLPLRGHQSPGPARPTGAPGQALLPQARRGRLLRAALMEGQQGSPAGAAEVEVTTSAAPAAPQLLAELEECYRRYLEDSEALVRKKTGFLHTVRSVLGTNPIKTSGIHQKFYDEVAERVAALAQALEAVPGQAVADAAVQLLLEERPRGKDLTQYGWLSAAQTLVVPLLPGASLEALRPLYEAYCAAHPRRDRLPKQQELVEAMERRLAE